MCFWTSVITSIIEVYDGYLLTDQMFHELGSLLKKNLHCCKEKLLFWRFSVKHDLTD